MAHGVRLTAPSHGRVVALVGPTGAGKTTTVAKLAARAALVRGFRAGLITLDDYRVGGEEQLRIFADLIPAPMHVASNRMELARALHALAECDLIYIDTSGRNPRDRQAHVELAGTLSHIDGLEIHLVVPAPSAPAYIDQLTARYQSALVIDRLLFTKLDEADDLSQMVRAPARLGLPVAHVTMGQAVPGGPGRRRRRGPARRSRATTARPSPGAHDQVGSGQSLATTPRPGNRLHLAAAGRAPSRSPAARAASARARWPSTWR